MSMFSFIDSVARAVNQLATAIKPPVVHVIERGQTLPQIAAQYRGPVPQEIYEQSIKAANPQVLNWDALYPDTELQLPPEPEGGPDVHNVAYAHDGGKPAQTPAQRTDDAVKADAQHSTPETRAELKASIDAEMKDRFQGEFNAHPTGAMYDTSTIDSYGRGIAARHADNPAAQSAINATVKDLRVDHEVQFTLMVAGGGDAKSAVSLLKSQWPTLSPEAQQRLATSPELGKLLNDKVEPYVSAPFANFKDNGDPKALQKPANDASQRLADLVEGLPPELANAVVTQNLDTVMRITDLKPMYAGEKFGGTSFTNMSRVAAALGDTPEGKQLRSDIATSYVAHSGDWRGQGAPFSENISNSVRDGVPPGLALEMASQLKAKGETELAGVFVQGVSHGAELLQGKIDKDLGEYKKMMGELARIMKYSEGLPPEAISKAVSDYIAGKGKDDPEWLNKYNSLESGLVSNAQALQQTLGELNALPADVKATYPDLNGKLQAIANSDSTLQAFGLAAARDRDFLIGVEAESTSKLFDITKVSKEGSEYLKRLASDGINQNALKVFADVDPSDPASIAAGKTRLQTLSTQYANVLGKDAEQYGRAIRELEGLLDVPPGDTHAMANQLNKFNDELKGIEGFGVNQPAGITFRSLGVAAAGLAFAKSTADAIDDPTWVNQIGAFGDAVGLIKDARDLMFHPGSIPIDRNSPLAVSALENGLQRFENINKVLGVVSAVGDIAKMVDALTSNRDYKGVEAGLYGLGATGTVVMALSTGPVGALVGSVMIGVSVFGQSALGDIRDTQDKVKGSTEFLKSAGFDEDAARILSDQGEDEGYLATPMVPVMLAEAQRNGFGTRGTGQPMTAEEAIKFMNDMKPEDLQVLVNQTRMAHQK